MSLSSASQLGSIIGNMSSNQSDIASQISPDDANDSLLIQNSAAVLLSQTVTVSSRTVRTDSFILDHVVYGALDSATLRLDGGYVEEELYAGSFNGSGYADKTTTTGLSTGNFNFTMCFWVNIQTAPTSGQGQSFFTLGPNVANQNVSLRYRNSAGNLQIGWENSVSNMYANQTLATDTWFFIVFRYTASTKVMSVQINNGGVTNLTAAIANLNIQAGAIAQLAWAYASGAPLKGYMDDFRYFESLLSAGDATILYNSGSGTNMPLGTEKMWFRLENNYNDSGSTGNHLTSQGTGNSFVTGKILVPSGTTVLYTTTI